MAKQQNDDLKDIFKQIGDAANKAEHLLEKSNKKKGDKKKGDKKKGDKKKSNKKKGDKKKGDKKKAFKVENDYLMSLYSQIGTHFAEKDLKAFTKAARKLEWRLTRLNSLHMIGEMKQCPKTVSHFEGVYNSLQTQFQKDQAGIRKAIGNSVDKAAIIHRKVYYMLSTLQQRNQAYQKFAEKL